MQLFEVFLVPGTHAQSEELLSEEVIALTKAQIMTPEQAEKVGFHGLPDDPRPRVFVACAERDGKLIHARLEASAMVGQFRVHYVDG